MRGAWKTSVILSIDWRWVRHRCHLFGNLMFVPHGGGLILAVAPRCTCLYLMTHGDSYLAAHGGFMSEPEGGSFTHGVIR
jgi:hypothetical protein